jgi:hypothetical protein
MPQGNYNRPSVAKTSHVRILEVPDWGPGARVTLLSMILDARGRVRGTCLQLLATRKQVKKSPGRKLHNPGDPPLRTIGIQE